MVSEGRRLTRAALALLGAAITTLLLLPVPGAAQTTLPQLPQVFLDTTYVSPTGSVINVAAGGDFQAALNAAQPGSVIVLQAGATFTGNFALPANAGPGWIYIVSSALASIPEGTRVTPAQAALMPKIVTPNSSSAITSGGGSKLYRLAGLEITGTLTNTGSVQYNLVMFGGQSNHDFVLDRSYIHGQQYGNYKRGVELEAARVAIIDSWIDDIHVDADEAQGIISWNGPGPYKIVNNTVRAAAINILFGPSGGTIASDIEIRGNTLEKPWSWRVGDPSFAGQHWTVKNILELKNARRVLIDGNLLRNCWVDPQAAFGQQGANAFVLTARNQWGTCSWCPVEDVTITNNISQHVGRGIGIANLGGSVMQRILVRNNLWLDVSASLNDGIVFMSYSDNDITIDHNTAFQGGAAIWTSGGGPFAFTNNLQYVGGGIQGGSSPSTNTHNVEIGGPGNFPTVGNFFPSLTAVGFVDFAGGNYALAAASPYRMAATDGTDIGVDFNALNAATACTLSGACGDPLPPPSPPPPPPPTTAVSLSPSSGAFASVAVGTTSAESDVWVTNTGTTGVSVSSIAVSPPFALSSTDCFPTSTWNGIMAPGTHCNAWVVFAPVASGSATGTLKVIAAGTSNAATLSGAGTTPPASPAVSVSPTSATVASSGTQQFTATVTGTTSTAVTWTASLGTISSTGLYTAPTVSANTTAPTVSANTTATVTATSVSAPTPSATVSVAITDPPPPSGSFSLSPTSVSFGSVNIGTTSAEIDVWVTNTGTTGVSVSGITVSGPFALSRTDCSPTSTWNGVMAPSTHCNVYVVFAPATSGSATGTLTVTAAGTSSAVALSGTGTGSGVTDVTAPVISAGTSSSTTSSSTTIGWTTNEASDTQVEYGLTTAYGNTTSLKTSLVTSHSQALSGLARNTWYHYRVKSRDAAGNPAVSGDFTFKTKTR